MTCIDTGVQAVGWTGRKSSNLSSLQVEQVCLCSIQSSTLLVMTLYLPIRPVYPVEREVSSEVMAENPSVESVQPMEDQGVTESHEDSDDEGPVFLDFTGLAIGKEAEVSWNILECDSKVSLRY